MTVDVMQMAASQGHVRDTRAAVGVAVGPRAPVRHGAPSRHGGPLADGRGAQPVHEHVGGVGQVPGPPHALLDGDEGVLLGGVGLDGRQELGHQVHALKQQVVLQVDDARTACGRQVGLEVCQHLGGVALG